MVGSILIVTQCLIVGLLTAILLKLQSIKVLRGEQGYTGPPGERGEDGKSFPPGDYLA